MISSEPVAAGGIRTRGHDRAVTAVRTMIRGRAPHALLIGGPPGVGKTTLALDLAAGLLCDADDPAARPCRGCRGCRLVDRGLHPDLHRLVPGGAGDQIRIGSRERPEDGTIRRLAMDLALLPVEGGARIALIERADRMGDDAQTALLKTLEEPPSGVTIILCADDEDRLMPTVRSRCARIRLGPVGLREVEAILVEGGVADPPLAARVARLSGGRPGAARSLAGAPDALAARDEIGRILLDLLGDGPASRLAASRELIGRATDVERAMARAGEAAGDDSLGSAPRGSRNSRARTGRGRRAVAANGAGRAPTSRVADDADGSDGDAGAGGSAGGDGDGAAEPEDEGATRGTASASDRRRATGTVLAIWRDIARDLLIVGLGMERDVRDSALLDDLRGASTAIGDAAGPALARFLTRLEEAGELLEANVRPELILDTLLLAWPTTPGSLDGRVGAQPGPNR